MSDFLDVNGVLFPAANDSVTVELVWTGSGQTRAQDGSARVNFQNLKHHLKGRSVPVTLKEAVAWALLFAGQTDHARYDADLYTDKGTAPSVSTLATQAAGGRYSGKLTLGATTGALAYDGVWSTYGGTALVARFESGAWADYGITWSAAGACTNLLRSGVVQATAFPSWFTVTAATGQVKLLNTAGSAQDLDEFSVWAFEAPTSWLASLATFRSAQAMALAPAFVCAGDFHPVSLTCVGHTTSAKAVMGVLSAGFAVLRAIDLDVEEA
jgi:hypothetical protein